MLRPLKSLGQHFLIDDDAAFQIVNALSLEPPRIMEIGPGPGVLTEILNSNKYIESKFVELDKRMVEYLHSRFPDLGDRIINKDVLRLDWSEVFEQEFQIVGNLPYNISTQIVFKMLEHRDRVPLLVGMFQREMAKRICADPGNKTYGVITVLTQLYYDVEYLFELPPSSFDPPPKVHSAVIRLKRKKSLPEVDHKAFRTVVKKAFSQRRKKLRNALSGEKFIEREEVKDFMQKRAEELSVDDFIYLTKLRGEYD